MKILIIGGTGTISSAITRQLAESGHDLWLLNRGTHKNDVPSNVKQIFTDINDERSVLSGIADETFDAVCDFIAFTPDHVARDVRLFSGLTRQYVFISSASAYAKPLRNPYITEGTTLANPHWQYSRDKIACEELLMREYRENGFPVTIVRPSHTYGERAVPLSIHGPSGSWPVLKRMLDGKPVLVHGDGTSLWTLTWNEDFARGFIGLLGNPKAIGEAFQIMSDEQLTWNQIYECVAQALFAARSSSHAATAAGSSPASPPLRLYHVASDFLAAVGPADYDLEGNLIGDKAATVVFDCSKLRHAVPGFCCTTRFDEGARRCVAYLLSHPELQVEDPAFDAWCDRVIAALESTKKSLLS